MEAVNGSVARIVDIAQGADGQAAPLTGMNPGRAGRDRATQRNTALFKDAAAATQTLPKGTTELIEAVSLVSTENQDGGDSAADPIEDVSRAPIRARRYRGGASGFPAAPFSFAAVDARCGAGLYFAMQNSVSNS